MTKTLFRLMMLLALFCFMGVFYYAMQIDKKNVPPPDMRMPAGTSGGKPIVLQDDGKPANPLEAQHMTSNELAMKLSDIVAEALSFTKGNFVYNSTNAEKYFTTTGYAQYKEFLTKASFESILADGTLQAAAYVEQEALEITHGVFSGAFKWLFEVPVTISFIPINPDTYRNGGIKPENRRVLLRAQFSRVADPNDPLAVKIEVWQILPPRRG
jgi:hypothetical protein